MRTQRSTELVIARFCEDLAWVADLSRSFDRTTIYDKSADPARTRDRIHLGGWSSSDGPPRGTLWPGAIPVDNVGCESHTHMHHTVERWTTLADITVFLSGDAPTHFPKIAQETRAALQLAQRFALHYHPYGPEYTCDRDGKPHVDRPFPELAEAWRLFFPQTVMPETLRWHGTGMYLVTRDRIQQWDLATWRAARDWCQRKIHSLAMERLYDTLFA